MTAGGCGAFAGGGTRRPCTAPAAPSPRRPRRTSPSGDPSSPPSNRPGGRSPRGSGSRIEPGTGSKSSIPTRSQIDEFGLAGGAPIRAWTRIINARKPAHKLQVGCPKSNREPTHAAAGLSPRPTMARAEPTTAGAGTAHSWRRGPYTVLGEARKSPGLRRVRTGVDAVRIALFTDSYLPTVDGVVTSVLTTRRQLEAHGHQAVVFAPEDPHRRGKREPGTIYVRAKEFRHYPGYRLAMFPGREADLIKEMGIAAIHIHRVGFVGIKGIWASWHAKVPRVSTFHTMIHETLAFYSPFGLNLHLLERGLRFYLRVFLRKTHGVVVPSRAILEEILALSPSAKIADVIPTGVDPERFHPG